MNRKTKLIYFCIVGFILIILMAIMHEQVHVQIYSSYGIDSKIELFKSFPNFATQPEANCPNDYCTLAHNINEVVGYTILPLMVLIYFGILFLLLGDKEE